MTARRGWFGRVKASAREKLIRAVQEAAVDPASPVDARHRELVGLVTSQNAAIAELRTAVDTLEFRMRRDIAFASDLEAVAQAAEFAEKHLRNVPTFTHPHETLRFALDAVSIDGLALEFGVAEGATLQIIADAWRAGDNVGVVTGFDSFEGLPENWRTGFPKGTFAQDSAPEVPGAHIVTGRFEQTLATFLARNRGPIAFLHLDADLYSATDFVLRTVDARLVPGTVIVFDEFVNFPGWPEHEYRAWTEYIARTGLEFEYLAYTSNGEQVAVRITGGEQARSENSSARRTRSRGRQRR